MLIHCRHCHTPFTLTPETMHAALDQLEEQGWKHYNAYCPRCGKPNVVPRDQLERAAPEWSADGSVQTSRPPVVSTPVAPPPAPKPVQQAAAAKPAPTASKPAAKKAAVKGTAKPAAKKAAPKKAAKPKAKKPTAKKAAKKSAAKKPAKKKKK